MAEQKQKIIEMLNEIHTERFLKMIYGFVRRLHREEKGMKDERKFKEVIHTIKGSGERQG